MTKLKSATIGALAISMSAILWGLDGVVLTPRLLDDAGHHLDTGYAVFVLHAFPFLLMTLFFRKEFLKWKTFSKADIFNFLLVALMGGALGTMFIVKALFTVEFQDLTIVALLQKLQPVFGIALAAIILKEKMSRYYGLWASLAIIAGYFLTFGFSTPNIQTGEKTVLAAGYALLAAFAFSSSTVLSKKVLNKFAFTTAAFYRYLFTTLIMLVYMVVFNKWGQFGQTPGMTWSLFVIIGLTAGSGAIFLYYYGLRHVKAMISTICELLFPVSVIIFDYLINGNRLDAVQWGSIVVMFIAVYMLNHTRHKA